MAATIGCEVEEICRSFVRKWKSEKSILSIVSDFTVFYRKKLRPLEPPLKKVSVVDIF